MIAGDGEKAAIGRERQCRNHRHSGVDWRLGQLERIGVGRSVVGAAFANPAFDQGHFCLGQRVAFLGHVRLRAADFFQDGAGFDVAGLKGRAVLSPLQEGLISGQIELAF